jgi:hypothetical protein
MTPNHSNTPRRITYTHSPRITHKITQNRITQNPSERRQTTSTCTPRVIPDESRTTSKVLTPESFSMLPESLTSLRINSEILLRTTQKIHSECMITQNSSECIESAHSNTQYYSECTQNDSGCQKFSESLGMHLEHLRTASECTSNRYITTQNVRRRTQNALSNSPEPFRTAQKHTESLHSFWISLRIAQNASKIHYEHPWHLESLGNHAEGAHSL